MDTDTSPDADTSTDTEGGAPPMPAPSRIEFLRDIVKAGAHASVVENPKATAADYRAVADTVDMVTEVCDWARWSASRVWALDRVVKGLRGALRERDDALAVAQEEITRLAMLLALQAATPPDAPAPPDATPTAWIGHNGGDCPVAPGTIVEAQLRDGTLAEARQAGAFGWAHCSGEDPYSIVSYRIVNASGGPAPIEAPEAGSWGAWVEWEGGPCPVAIDALVEIRVRGSRKHECQSARDFLWDHLGTRTDIVAYRIWREAGEEPRKPETDEEFLTRRGVLPWQESPGGPGMVRYWGPGTDEAIADDGVCWRSLAAPFSSIFSPEGYAFSLEEGDTTTPGGRAECDARLVAHLRAEGEVTS